MGFLFEILESMLGGMSGNSGYACGCPDCRRAAQGYPVSSQGAAFGSSGYNSGNLADEYAWVESHFRRGAWVAGHYRQRRK